jgi:hypothetical protein
MCFVYQYALCIYVVMYICMGMHQNFLHKAYEKMTSSGDGDACKMHPWNL